jgi:CHAT domain-containing protein
VSRLSRNLIVGLLIYTCALPLVCAVGADGAAPASAADAASLLAQAAADSTSGRQRQAARQAAQAAQIAERLGDEILIIRALATEGRALSLAGEPRQARERLEAAIARARAANRPEIAAGAANDLGTLLSAQGEFDSALRQFESSIADTAATGDESQVLRATLNRARTLTQIGRVPEAREVIRGIGTRLNALADSTQKVALLTSAGQLLAASASEVALQPADFALAEALLRDAAACGARISDARGQSYALGYASELLAAAGRDEAALTLARQAIHRAQLAAAPESLYRWQWQVGRLLKRRHELPGAVDAYRGAVGTLESVRQDLAASTRAAGTGDGFRHNAGPLYVELVDLLLQQAVMDADATQREDLLRQARDTMETLKSAELEDYFRDDCVAGLKSKTVGIDTLAAHTAAIYPVVLPDRLALLVSAQGQLRLYESSVNAATLEGEVARLRARLEKRSTYQYLPHAKQLYDWVLRPLEADLQAAGITTLVFVPDGALRTVPLAALHDGTGFLVERYAVATVPGLTLTDPRPLGSSASLALLSGLTESVEGFAALPAVAGELDSVSKIYPGKRLQDGAFTPQSFAEALTQANYSVVHIASHGQFGENIDDTFLLTHAGRIGMDDLESEIGRTATREQPVELLTLSACQTAAGNERAALGLAGVAVKAGARSAVATLWSVNDRASGSLISAFYQSLKGEGASKAAALRTAQLALLAEPRYRHPAYWSPFLLIGNWL